VITSSEEKNMVTSSEEKNMVTSSEKEEHDNLSSSASESHRELHPSDNDGINLIPIVPTSQTAPTMAEKKGLSEAVLGMAMVLISTFCFSSAALCVSLVGSAVPSLVSALVRFSAQVLLTILTIAVTRRGKLLQASTWLGTPSKRFMLLRRGLWGVGGLSSYFLAISMISLSDATSLTFANVPMTAVLAYFFLKEPYTIFDLLTAVMAFAGVILITQPVSIFGAQDTSAPPIPFWLLGVICGGAFCMSMAYIMIRQIGPTEDPLIVTLYFGVIGLVVVPILAALSQGFGDASKWTPEIFMYEFVIGLSGWLGQLLLNRGVALSPAGPATVMRYADVVFSLIFQSFVIQRSPGVLKLLGTFLIMSCMSSTIYKQYMKGKKSGPTTIKPVDDADAIAAWCEGVSFENKKGAIIETR
jgi:drug/metabolite transporter (DMT)-like permease